MSPPGQKRPKDLAGYLEALSRLVFAAGMNWRVVEAKWDGIRKALVENEAVIRSRPKIEAVIDNARTIVELDTQHHGFRRYLRSHSDFDALVADLKREFRFVGDSGAYHFLYIVNEPVPVHEEWMAGRKARPAARQAGRKARPTARQAGRSAAGRKP
jgi:3-methyladenine DNA glycosylase Tag